MADEDVIVTGEDGEDQEEEQVKIDPAVLGSQLLAAAKSGDYAEAQQLVKMGAPVNHRDAQNPAWNPLMWASCNGHTKLVHLLLTSGAAVEYEMANMTNSAESKTSDLAKGEFTSQRNAMLSARDTPLHWAAFKGHLEVVWLLLKHGLDPFVLDSCGNTSLHLAASGGHNKVMECLLSQGSDLTMKNFYGNTALSLATEPVARKTLSKAIKAKACAASGKEFSATVWRYRCSCSGDYFCKEETVSDNVVARVGSTDTRPVRYSLKAKQEVLDAETKLKEACRGSHGAEHLQTLATAVRTAKDIGASVLLVHRGEVTYSRLLAQVALTDEMDAVQNKRPISRRGDMQDLIAKLSKARDEGVSDAVEDGEALLLACKSEVALMGAVGLCEPIECAGEACASELNKLDSCIATAEQAQAEAALLENAKVLARRMHAELELQKSMRAPGVQAVVDEEGEPTEHELFTLEDGSQYNSSIPGQKLVCYQKRVSRLEKAVAEAEEVGAFMQVQESGQEELKSLQKELKVEEANEEARLKAEEEARIKAEKKAKKKKKKKK